MVSEDPDAPALEQPPRSPEDQALDQKIRASKKLLENSDTKPVPPPSNREMKQAKRLLERGMAHYKRGDYDNAEKYLTEAIGLYPFLPAANLALGKILLIRGSATRDMALMESARLMFEMARALDPSLREPELLLELFIKKAD